MGSLRIERLTYSGDEYFFESEMFSKNIVLIEGDNGTGKTTFCDLIYFALGGRVTQFLRDADKRHKEITSDTDNFVELLITIDGQRFLLRRYLTENEITVTPVRIEHIAEVPGDPQDVSDAPRPGQIYQIDASSLLLADTDQSVVLAVFRSESTPETFSDWMLDKLGIVVVDLYQGSRTFKVNFTDLMRLMYHDQQPDPEGIFKKLDTKPNFLADSELLRKAIFELLVGRSFSHYYDAIATEKKATERRSIAKAVLDEYESVASKIRISTQVRNRSFLENELREKEAQLDRLEESRKAFKRNRSKTPVVSAELDNLKNEIIDLELSLSELNSSLIDLFDERYRLSNLMDETRREVLQIHKVIFTHNQLNLFSADTCPYCLSKVERAAGHCVCGAPIEEEQFERFFYTSQEYNQILKSKLKAQDTIEIALRGCNDEISITEDQKQAANERLPILKEELAARLDVIDESVDLETINDIDDKFLEVRSDITDLLQALELESKLDALQKDFDRATDALRDAELARKTFELEAQKDIASKTTRFGEIYNDLMVATLANCRSARIDPENYGPIINDGEYREASSLVPIRLMYYLALLKLSMEQSDVTYPKFLLVDTPETAGIELDNLKNCLSQFDSLEEAGVDYQIILATGLDKYPNSLSSSRVLYMPNEDSGLLQKRTA